MSDSQLFSYESEYYMPETPSLRYEKLVALSRRMKQGQKNSWLFVGNNEALASRSWWIAWIVMMLFMASLTIWIWVYIIFPSGMDAENIVWIIGTIAAMWGMMAGLSWSKRRYDHIKIFEPARVMLLHTTYGQDTPIPVRFRRNLREGNRLPEPATVCACLSCFELTETTVGTTTRCEQSMLWKSESVGVLVEAGATCIDAEFQLRTPPDAIPSSYRKRFSMASRKANISWMIEIYQEIGKFTSHLIVPIGIQAPEYEVNTGGG